MDFPYKANGRGFTPNRREPRTWTTAQIFKRIDGSANTVTIQRAGTDTIDGGPSVTLSAYVNKYLVADDAASMWRTFS